MSSQSSLRTAVRAMAMFEATKGVAALLGLWGVLSLLHHDIHRLVLELIGHMGLSPQQRYPALLLQAADALNVTPVSTLVLLGCLYAAVRFIEAWGLWQDKAWGEWFGVLASTVYLPFELLHLLHRSSWQAMLVLALNIALVMVLLARLIQKRRKALVPAMAAE